MKEANGSGSGADRRDFNLGLSVVAGFGTGCSNRGAELLRQSAFISQSLSVSTVQWSLKAQGVSRVMALSVEGQSWPMVASAGAICAFSCSACSGQ